MGVLILLVCKSQFGKAIMIKNSLLYNAKFDIFH